MSEECPVTLRLHLLIRTRQKLKLLKSTFGIKYAGIFV